MNPKGWDGMPTCSTWEHPRGKARQPKRGSRNTKAARDCTFPQFLDEAVPSFLPRGSPFLLKIF